MRPMSWRGSVDASFADQVRTLVGYIQSEMVKGRLTAVQAEVMVSKVRQLEAAHTAALEEL